MLSDHDIQDYIDGRLGRQARAMVAAQLLARPALAVEVDTLRRQNEILKAVGQEILDEPIPERLRNVLRQRSLDANAAERRRISPVAIAATILLMCFASGLGWLANDLLRPQPNVQEEIAADVANAFSLYGTQGYPVDFPPDRTADLVSWISRALARQVAPPDLAAFGYSYHGGRLIPAEGVSIGVFQFSGGEHGRLVVFFWPSKAPPGPQGLRLQDKLAARFWHDAGLSFAVVSDARSPTFDETANAVFSFYRQNLDSG
jgi:anti-sigma factor RsiW